MKVLAIALNTAREAIRNQILYSTLFFAAVVIGLAAIFGSVSMGNPAKFVKDFALMGISLFGVVIAVVVGVNLLQKELGRRTIFNILSKPVVRWQFVIGKFLGLCATLGLIVSIMCMTLVTLLALYEGKADWGLVLASGTALLELIVVTASALFFSSIVVTPTLAGLFTAATFVAGRSAGYLQYFLENEYSAGTQFTARFLYWLLPHLHQFNIADKVVHGSHIDPAELAMLAVYAFAYTGILLVLSVAAFSRREFT